MNTIILDATTKSITAVMAGAPAATQPDFTAAYADATAAVFTEGSNDGTLNSTTPVTIVAAPAASTRRIIKSITIMNRDTAAVVVTLNLVSAGGTRQIVKVTLAVGDTLTTDGTYDTNGALKTKTTSISEGDIILTDIITGDVSTTKHGFAPKAVAPGAGLVNVLGIANGETVPSNKALFDTSNPAALGSAAPGTQVIASRRDHVHAGSHTALADIGTYTHAQIDLLLARTSYYGVTWNESTDAYSRTGMLAGIGVGSFPGNAALPIQSLMKRCIMNDAGAVVYYLDPADSTKKADGSAADLTGASGQVMVEIPAFYIRYSYASNTHNWDISLYPLNGYILHPAFLKNGIQVAYRYCGAYEGALYDVSGAVYTDGSSGQVKDFTATTGDKLSSVSGKLAVTNETRANFRTISANRGTGWRQLDFYLLSAIQLLFLVEYASFNSQSMIGAGISNVTDWAAYNNYYPIASSGNSNVIGNASGNTAGSASCATEASKYMSYRGIENWFGHIWKFVDGININDNVPYASNTNAQFADDTASNYTNLGITLCASNGWQNTLTRIATGFLPTAVGASSTTKITDYYWQDAGWRVALVGGDAHNGADNGGFCCRLHHASDGLYSNIGGRLAY